MLVILAVNIGLFTCSCIVIIKHACKVRQLERKKLDRQAHQNIFAKKACKMNCGLLGIICLLGLPTGVLFGVSYIVPLLTSSIFTYISVLFLLTYNAFQGFILFLLVTVLNSDLRNHWKKLLCGCIKKKRQASCRQDKLREHAVNRMNKTSKMAQGITEGQHQEENMEKLHVTDTHTP